MIARHIGNVETEIGLDHWPNIYCGVAVFLFFLLYLACKKISVKEKALYCGLLLLFFASFSCCGCAVELVLLRHLLILVAYMNGLR